jgi:hypothetical protein
MLEISNLMQLVVLCRDICRHMPSWHWRCAHIVLPIYFDAVEAAGVVALLSKKLLLEAAAQHRGMFCGAHTAALSQLLLLLSCTRIVPLQSYCDEVQAGISQATADASALLPITLKLTGGKVSDCIPGAAALQLPELAAGTAAAAAAPAGPLQQGLPLQQVQQLQQLREVQQAQQLVQAAAAAGSSSPRHSTQHH